MSREILPRREVGLRFLDTGGVASDRPLWECPSCGRTFAARHQMHTCAVLGDVDRHFARSAPEVRETFDAVLDVVRGLGPVEVLPQRTRIALHVRMSFAAFMPRAQWLDGHLVLAQAVPNARWTRIERFSARNVLHAFRLTSADDVDEPFRGWLADAYAVGCQRVAQTDRVSPGPHPIPHGRTARRIEWSHLPPSVRSAVQDRTGSPVDERRVEDVGLHARASPRC